MSFKNLTGRGSERQQCHVLTIYGTPLRRAGKATDKASGWDEARRAGAQRNREATTQPSLTGKGCSLSRKHSGDTVTPPQAKRKETWREGRPELGPTRPGTRVRLWPDRGSPNNVVYGLHSVHDSASPITVATTWNIEGDPPDPWGTRSIRAPFCCDSSLAKRAHDPQELWPGVPARWPSGRSRGNRLPCKCL